MEAKHKLKQTHFKKNCPAGIWTFDTAGHETNSVEVALFLGLSPAKDTALNFARAKNLMYLYCFLLL